MQSPRYELNDTKYVKAIVIIFAILSCIPILYTILIGQYTENEGYLDMAIMVYFVLLYSVLGKKRSRLHSIVMIINSGWMSLMFSIRYINDIQSLLIYMLWGMVIPLAIWSQIDKSYYPNIQSE